MVPLTGLEPARLSAQRPQRCGSTNSPTKAFFSVELGALVVLAVFATVTICASIIVFTQTTPTLPSGPVFDLQKEKTVSARFNHIESHSQVVSIPLVGINVLQRALPCKSSLALAHLTVEP